MPKPLKKLYLAATLVLSGMVGGCAAIGPTDDPFLRSLTWDRYAGGDDLDRACAAGQPPRVRLVYNAVETEQRRTYDFIGDAEGGAMLEARVIGQGLLNDSRNPISLRDPLAPWRGQFALYHLTGAEMGRVMSALDDSGFEGPSPDGLFLRGDSFFWTASACRDGSFHFYAWSAEDQGFGRVAARLLAAVQPFDATGVPVAQPRELALPPYSTYFNSTSEKMTYIPRRFQVGKNGLRYSQGTVN